MNLVVQQIDFVAFGVAPTLERYLMYDLTMPVIEQSYLLMAPYPEEESRLTAVTRPFSGGVNPIISS